MHSFPNVICKETTEPKNHTPKERKKKTWAGVHAFFSNVIYKQFNQTEKKESKPNKQLNHHMGKKSNIGLDRLTCY